MNLSPLTEASRSEVSDVPVGIFWWQDRLISSSFTAKQFRDNRTFTMVSEGLQRGRVGEEGFRPFENGSLELYCTAVSFRDNSEIINVTSPLE